MIDQLSRGTMRLVLELKWWFVDLVVWVLWYDECTVMSLVMKPWLSNAVVVVWGRGGVMAAVMLKHGLILWW
ncbi:hypothetical protein M0R45_016254 [Rubus argutus]|uniref:Transmembrane protein n=1 Tax=Rubus argutus TaxID=59490 RepID=A0AAW1XSJ5_RUBAR